MPPESPGTELKRGSKGPEVRQVQQRLQELGYDIGPRQPGAPAGGPKPQPGGKGIAWGRKVSPQFRAKVVQIARDLKTSPDFLMAAMAFETGGAFSPSETNKAGSGAVGADPIHAHHR